MSDIRPLDADRTEKLRQWLEGKGVDVVQVGDDLAMPSPFKEAIKRKTEGSGYVDRKRRLWAKVITGQAGKPELIWQCWWSKSINGKGKGGHGSYAVAMAARASKGEIDALLGLEFDEAVQQAETQEDKAIALMYQSIREEGSRSIAAKEAQSHRVKQGSKIAAPMPQWMLGLYHGNYITNHAEEMVTARGISKKVVLDYELAWDVEAQAVVLPWLDTRGEFQFCQWWDGESYRFGRKDGVHFQKEDGLFGCHLYRNERIILCEGCFTAMSLTGMALGGSTLTEQQMATILSLNPKEVILAFDNDNGGLYGSKGVYQGLRGKLSDKTRIDITMPPYGFNDWNDVIREKGVAETMKTFVERVQYSRDVGPIPALAATFSPIESKSVRNR